MQHNKRMSTNNKVRPNATRIVKAIKILLNNADTSRDDDVKKAWRELAPAEKGWHFWSDLIQREKKTDVSNKRPKTCSQFKEEHSTNIRDELFNKNILDVFDLVNEEGEPIKMSGKSVKVYRLKRDNEYDFYEVMKIICSNTELYKLFTREKTDYARAMEEHVNKLQAVFRAFNPEHEIIMQLMAETFDFTIDNNKKLIFDEKVGFHEALKYEREKMLQIVERGPEICRSIVKNLISLDLQSSNYAS